MNAIARRCLCASVIAAGLLVPLAASAEGPTRAGQLKASVVRLTQRIANPRYWSASKEVIRGGVTQEHLDHYDAFQITYARKVNDDVPGPRPVKSHTVTTTVFAEAPDLYPIDGGISLGKRYVYYDDMRKSDMYQRTRDIPSASLLKVVGLKSANVLRDRFQAGTPVSGQSLGPGGSFVLRRGVVRRSEAGTEQYLTGKVVRMGAAGEPSLALLEDQRLVPVDLASGELRRLPAAVATRAVDKLALAKRTFGRMTVMNGRDQLSGGTTWGFGKEGPDNRAINALTEAVESAKHYNTYDTFAALALLARGTSLTGREPTILVEHKVSQIRVDQNGIFLPTLNVTVPYTDIVATQGYAHRASFGD